MEKAIEISYESIAAALAQDHYKIYYVNTETDRYIEYRAFDAYEKTGEGGSEAAVPKENFSAASRRVIESIVHPDDREEVLEEFTKQNVLSALEEDGIFTLELRVNRGAGTEYIRIKVTKMTDKSDPHIVVALSRIDAQIRREAEYETAHRERVTFGKIAEALAADYFLIYYVDLENDHFIEYSAHEDFRKLEIEEEGFDFFGTSRKNAMVHVYEDDRKLFISTIEKESLVAELEKNGSCSIRYRLILGDVPTYVSLKATMIEDDHGKHIIIGVSNIDSQVRREQETARELGVVRQLVNRDHLTGVKNKYAYSEAEKAIDDDIGIGIAKDFAIVVCDVNGLKVINDTYGHSAGDKYIKDGCKLICDVFRHSPVYRIGGDEFCAILKGADFQRSPELMDEIETQVRDNIAKGGVSIACGIASFDPESDGSVKSVFERADEAMYRNKKLLKSL